MVAWVRVVDTPYFGKSAADGTSTLTGLKPGDYRVSVGLPGPEWQPKVQQIHVGAEGNTRAVVELQPPAPLMAPITPPRAS